MPAKNLRKPIYFGPRLDDAPPALPNITEPVPTRVKTTWELKRARYRRQNIASTSTGTYTFSQSTTPPSDYRGSEPSSNEHSPASSRDDLPIPPSTPLRYDSSLAGWSSDLPDQSTPKRSSVRPVTLYTSQWSKWTKIVIPALIGPYRSLMRRTRSLAEVDRDLELECSCGGRDSRLLNVTCVYFDGSSWYFVTCTILLTFSSFNRNSSAYLSLHISSPCLVGPRFNGLLPDTSHTCH